MKNSTIIEALGVTYAAIGQEVSDAVLEVVARELKNFPREDVLAALRRCMLEVKGRLSLADVIERIPGQHPGAEEAWAMVAKALTDEGVTIVETREMAGAFALALALADDPVAARMAFKAEYQNQVARARAAGERPQWFVSPGADAAAREGPIIAAVRDGRLGLVYASQFLIEEHRGEIERLLTDNPVKRIAA